MRKLLRIGGYAEGVISVDPEEYRGLRRLEVTDHILEALRSIPPEVSFFPENVDEAVDEVMGWDVGGESGVE